MKMIKNAIVMAMIMSMSVAVFAQDNQVRTINIDFRDEGQNTTMNMSLPITVIESFRPHIEQALESVQQGDHQIDFQEIWQAVKDAGPTDFVEIKSEDADVKVSTTDTELRVSVQEKQDGHDIDVAIPLAVCEALFAGGELDLDAIVTALEDMAGQNLITITGDQINGRVWIE